MLAARIVCLVDPTFLSVPLWRPVSELLQSWVAFIEMMVVSGNFGAGIAYILNSANTLTFTPALLSATAILAAALIADF